MEWKEYCLTNVLEFRTEKIESPQSINKRCPIIWDKTSDRTVFSQLLQDLSILHYFDLQKKRC